MSTELDPNYFVYRVYKRTKPLYKKSMQKIESIKVFPNWERLF